MLFHSLNSGCRVEVLQLGSIGKTDRALVLRILDLLAVSKDIPCD